MESQGHIVIVVFPFQGHINPMLQLAKILHTKGFKITIIHHQFNSPNSAKNPEFTFLPIPDDDADKNLSKSPADFLRILTYLNETCGAPVEAMLRRILEHDRINCIVYDGFMYFAQEVADQLGLPGICVRTSGVATILAFAFFAREDGQGYFSLIDTISEELGPDVRKLKMQRIPTLNDNSMSEVRNNLAAAMKKSSALIVNSMSFLEQEAMATVERYFPSTRLYVIGPFHKFAPNVETSLLNEDTTCISWLDKHAPKSVLYVSFGSMASMTENDLIEVGWGLVNSGQPFLWVVRPGLVHGSSGSGLFDQFLKDCEEKIGERGCIVTWAPQKEVLGHEAVGGFWTHCGWNSLLESICEGVPMLCKPFFGDQLMNVRYLCDVWRIGLEVDTEFHRGNIEKAIRRLMVDEGEELKQRASEFKEIAEICMKEDGSSYKSINELTKQILS